MSKIYQLRQKYAEECDALEKLSDQPQAYAKKEGQIVQLGDQIRRLVRTQQLSREVVMEQAGITAAELRQGGMTVADLVANSNRKWYEPRQSRDGAWKNLGENLQAIIKASNHGPIDERLTRAPFGMGEADPSGGGFLVDVDFANTILSRAYDMGDILQRCFKIPISANANGVKIPGIDEQSRATGSRWGGVRSTWVAEGDTIGISQPKFRLIELDLKKLVTAWVITDEMMADASALTAIANQAFAEEVSFMVEDSVIRGTGQGMPEGILVAPATVTVAPEAGQAPKTFLWENVLNMWANTWARSRPNLCWFINQEIEPQLYQLRQVIGTGGVPVYLSPGEAKTASYSTLLGRPVIAVEYCNAPGVPGDVILADFSQYVLADKNQMQQMSSIHVRFLTDEMTFRLTYRVDGEPIWHTPLKPYQGTQLRSPFVILGGR
jgi:HK97 family phage major capsid protein